MGSRNRPRSLGPGPCLSRRSMTLLIRSRSRSGTRRDICREVFLQRNPLTFFKNVLAQKLANCKRLSGRDCWDWPGWYELRLSFLSLNLPSTVVPDTRSQELRIQTIAPPACHTNVFLWRVPHAMSNQTCKANMRRLVCMICFFSGCVPQCRK